MPVAEASPVDAGIDLGGAIESAVESNIEEQPTDSGVELFGEETQPEGTEEVAAEGEAGQPAAAAPSTESDGPYPLAADGNGYVVPKQDFAIMDGLRQYAESVQNRFPTANDAEIAYQESSDLRAMRADYINGDDTDIDSILSHWAGGGETDPTLIAQFQGSFQRLADRLPDTLKQVNPNAYGKFVDSVVQRRIDDAYQSAAQSGDPQEFARAQYLDWGLTGQYRTELPKYDPEKIAQEQFQAQQKALQERENGLLDRDWKNFDQSSVSGEKWKQYFSEIDRTLEPLKGSYPVPIIESFKHLINQNLMETLKRDSEWARTHNNELRSLKGAYEQAWRNNRPPDGLKPRSQYFINDFMTRARRYLPSIAKQVIDQAKLPTTKTAIAAAQPQKTPPKQPGQPAAQNGQPKQQVNGDVRPAGWDAIFH